MAHIGILFPYSPLTTSKKMEPPCLPQLELGMAAEVSAQGYEIIEGLGFGGVSTKT